MDKELKQEWTDAINSIMEMDKEKRRHFAVLLVHLAKCYTQTDDWKAVIVVQNANSLLTFSAGATDVEAIEMLELANDAALLAATADAPPKEMFN